MKKFTMTQSTVHWEWPPTIQSISEGCQFQSWNASAIWTLLTLIISAAGTWTEPPPYFASIIALVSLLICFHTYPIQYIVHFKARMMPSQCNSDRVISLLSVLQWHPPFSEFNSQLISWPQMSCVTQSSFPSDLISYQFRALWIHSSHSGPLAPPQTW